MKEFAQMLEWTARFCSWFVSCSLAAVSPAFTRSTPSCSQRLWGAQPWDCVPHAGELEESWLRSSLIWLVVLCWLKEWCILIHALVFFFRGGMSILLCSLSYFQSSATFWPLCTTFCPKRIIYRCLQLSKKLRSKSGLYFSLLWRLYSI